VHEIFVSDVFGMQTPGKNLVPVGATELIGISVERNTASYMVECINLSRGLLFICRPPPTKRWDRLVSYAAWLAYIGIGEQNV
jgi:hypothetical protein